MLHMQSQERRPDRLCEYTAASAGWSFIGIAAESSSNICLTASVKVLDEVMQHGIVKLGMAKHRTKLQVLRCLVT